MSGQQLDSNKIAGVKIQYKWLWLYGFVHLESGENYWWILPYTNTQLLNRVLADFAREFQLNRNKRVLLVLDQAGWHICDQLKLPEGLDLLRASQLCKNRSITRRK